MLTARLSRRSLYGVVSLCLTAGLAMWGCAPPESLQPPQPPVDVRQRLATTEACVAGAQEALRAAAADGVSTADLAPANGSMADLQAVLDEATRLAQQGKQHEAAERATRGLAECDKIVAMVVKARQDTAERTVRAQLESEAETRLAWTVACVDGARQAIGLASVAGVKTAVLTSAMSALDRAETALQQAWAGLAQHDPKGAVERLEMAQADCQTARDATDRASAAKRQAPAARSRRR